MSMVKYFLTVIFSLYCFSANPSFAQKKIPSQMSQNPFRSKGNKTDLKNLSYLKVNPADSELRSSVRGKFGDWKKEYHTTKYRGMRIPSFLSPDQADAYRKLYRTIEGDVEIHWDKKNLIPIFVSGKNLKSLTPSSNGVNLTWDALDSLTLTFLQENQTLVRIDNPKEEFKTVSHVEDELGMKHIRYQQIYKGIEVWGCEIYMHLNGDNTLRSFNGRYLPTASDLINVKPAIGVDQAIQTAKDHLSSPRVVWKVLQTKLMVYHTPDRTPHLAWLVDISDGFINHWFYFVDAHNGKFLNRVTRTYYDGPVTGSGTDLHNVTRTLNLYQLGSTYYMIDASKPMFNSSASTMPNDPAGVVWTLNAQNTENQLYQVTSSNQNSWSDKATVSASYYAGLIYDYYKNVHSRNSIDGNGMNMPFIVHYKTNYNNAFWNGQAMIFGDGDGTNFSNIVGALDVAAHELTHGVTQHTANLIYQFQSGALNESFSDMFGTMVEFYVEGASGDWLCGEDVFTPGTPGDALRDMEDPASSHVPSGYKQPTKMSEYQDLPNNQEGDWGGVHINSGIPNRACFLVADSIGRAKTERIYYRALTNYLTQNSQFIDARLALCHAAADLYGADGNEERAVKHAFDVVEVLGDSGSLPPDTLPPVEGTEWIAAVDGVDSTLWRIDTTGTVFQQLTTTRVFGKPTATEEGNYILFVDRNHNLRIIGSNGEGETSLSTSGTIWSVAISPNGKKLAYTSIYVDTTIYVLDLVDTTGASDKSWKINRIAGLEGSTAWMLYADAIDWKSDNEYILFDAVTMKVINLQDNTYYWSIYSIRASDGATWQIFPSQSDEVSVGNPVYASNNDYLMAFDFVNAYGDCYVLGANLETGEVGTITYNYGSLGFPSYSNNDSKVIYQYCDGYQYALWVVGLESNRITGAGNDYLFALDGKCPVWFAVGKRPSGVEDQEETSQPPSDFVLGQNYPNPFNPVTTIRYEIKNSGSVKPVHITLSIYNILGQKVRTLLNQEQLPGKYEIMWDGKDDIQRSVSSGVYFYRLCSGKSTVSKRMVLLK